MNDPQQSNLDPPQKPPPSKRFNFLTNIIFFIALVFMLMGAFLIGLYVGIYSCPCDAIYSTQPYLDALNLTSRVTCDSIQKHYDKVFPVISRVYGRDSVRAFNANFSKTLLWKYYQCDGRCADIGIDGRHKRERIDYDDIGYESQSGEDDRDDDGDDIVTEIEENVDDDDKDIDNEHNISNEDEVDFESDDNNDDIIFRDSVFSVIKCINCPTNNIRSLNDMKEWDETSLSLLTVGQDYEPEFESFINDMMKKPLKSASLKNSFPIMVASLSSNERITSDNFNSRLGKGLKIAMSSVTEAPIAALNNASLFKIFEGPYTYNKSSDPALIPIKKFENMLALYSKDPTDCYHKDTCIPLYLATKDNLLKTHFMEVGAGFLYDVFGGEELHEINMEEQDPIVMFMEEVIDSGIPKIRLKGYIMGKKFERNYLVPYVEFMVSTDSLLTLGVIASLIGTFFVTLYA